jgi:hypothetical protein
MRHPPPVSVRCGGGRGWRWAVAALRAVAAAAAGAWLAGLLDRFDLAWAVAVLAAGAVLGLSRPWRLPPPVVLVWDGGTWRADGLAGELQVALDLGPWMLLRLRATPAAGGSARRGRWPGRWLPVSAAEAGAGWHALRVAAHAGVPTAEPLAAPPHV